MRYLITTTIIGFSLLFTACQKDGMTDENRKDHTMISFEVPMEVDAGAVTRGMPITSVSEMETMAVFLYHTGTSTWAEAGATATPNVMNNMKVVKQQGNWDYSPSRKPWQSQYNTIFAYAPFATASNGIAVQPSYTGAPTITYTVPQSCVNQPDLMVAAMQEDQYLGTVSFKMEHALACVGFKVNGRYQEKITKIAIKGASVSGTLSLNHTAGGVPLWTNVAAATNTEYTSGIKNDIVGDQTMMDVMNVDGYLMMIPQTLGADAKVIVTVDGVDKEVSLSGKEWKAGERYTYNIDILYEPIILGYFGGWDEANQEYTKLLELDHDASEIEMLLPWSTKTTLEQTHSDNKHYGLTNIAILKNKSSDLSLFPAVKYCEDKGAGWYLPAQNQLMAIWIVHESVPLKFSLRHNAYQSSTEVNGAFHESPIVFFRSLGYTDNYLKKNQYNVRCVRDVTP